MYEGFVRQVQKIVHKKAVVALDMEMAAGRSPFWIVVPVKIRNFRGVGGLGIAHPEPYPAPFLDQRISADPAARRHVRLSRNLDAPALRIEFQPVIGALQRIPDQLALRQRHAAVRAGVGHRDRRPVLFAEEYDGFVEDMALQQRAADLVRHGRDIPVIPQEHRTVLHYGAGAAAPVCRAWSSVPGSAPSSRPSTSRTGYVLSRIPVQLTPAPPSSRKMK